MSKIKPNFILEKYLYTQLKSLMMIEHGTDSSKPHSVLNFDGMPITADFIFNQIASSFKTQVAS